MKKKVLRAACAMTIVAGATGVVGVATVSPASANSRCTTWSHTHGALFWKRTDAFSYHTDGYYDGWFHSNHDHENSSPVECGHAHYD